MKPTREQILNEVVNAVLKDRQEVHGTPENSFGLIADLWSSYLSVHQQGPLQPHDVAAMMILLKVARLAKTPSHPDNWADAAGYAVCGGSVAPEQVNDTNKEPGGCFRCAGQPIEIRRKCEHNRASVIIAEASASAEEEELVTPVAHIPCLSSDKISIASSVARLLDRKTGQHFDGPDYDLIRFARHQTRKLTPEQFTRLMQLTALL